MTWRLAIDIFSLRGKVAVITGGGGLLGYEHAAAIAGAGGSLVLLDVDPQSLSKNVAILRQEFEVDALSLVCDITSVEAVEESQRIALEHFGGVHILVNNAARNPKVESSAETNFSRLENFPVDQWRLDLDVGLGGAFNCARVYGSQMVRNGIRGVIVNIASDLGLIAPDQRLYQVEGQKTHLQPVKPVTYSVVKHGLIGLTKYLATYWCEEGIRCNALSPGGVYTQQSDHFLSRINRLIPMGRMAYANEYRGAIVFLCSDASSYMNGANLVIDGGRSVW